MGTEHIQDEQYPHKDFFINYAPADSHWAEWIAWHLEQHNYSVTLSKWDFLPGSNSILELNKALTSTEQTIVILSPHYMNAIHTLPDWTVTFKKDMSGEHKRLIPVQVQQAEVEGLFSTITSINLIDQDETTALDRLIEGIKGIRAKPSKPPGFPGKKPLIVGFQLKNNPIFVGREHALASVYTALHAGSVVALTNALTTSNASIGKTQTANEYLYRYQSDYTLVIWIQDNPLDPSLEPFFQNIRSVVEELGLAKEDLHDDMQTLSILRDWLANQIDWFLVLDGVKDVQMVKTLLPTKRKGHVLITTRERAIASISQLVELDDRTDEEEAVSEKLSHLVDAALHSPNGEQLHLKLGETTIGRAPDNGIIKDDPSVSMYHAIITIKEGNHYISDLKESYGTFLNRQRLTPEIPYALHQGDTIQIGNVLFAYGSDATQLSVPVPIIDPSQGQATSLSSSQSQIIDSQAILQQVQETLSSTSQPYITNPQAILQQVRQGVISDSWRLFFSDKDSFENFRRLAIEIDTSWNRAFILLPFLTLTSILLLITLTIDNSRGALFIFLLTLFFEILLVVVFVIMMLDSIEKAPGVVIEHPYPEALLIVTEDGFIEYIDEQHQIDAVSFADLANVQLFTDDDHSTLVDLSYLDGRTGQWCQRAHFGPQVYIAQQILDGFIHYLKTQR